MANSPIVTINGNLVADPELKYTASGTAVANIRVAQTPRTFDKNTNQYVDGEALFLSVTLWKQAAENVAQSLTKGMRVIVVGELQQRSYQTKDGENRTVYEIQNAEVGPSLRYATAQVMANPRDGQGGNAGGNFGGGQQQGGNFGFGEQGQGGFGGQQPAQQGGFGQQGQGGFSGQQQPTQGGYDPRQGGFGQQGGFAN